MVEVIFEKKFRDESTGEDIYLLSIKLGATNIYTIPCKKHEFEMIHLKIKNIVNNNL